MTTVLIVLHVAAAIVLLGPVIVASSMFPRQAAEAHAGNAEAVGKAELLNKMTSRYGMLSMLIPVLGIIVMISGWEVFKSNYFLHTSIVLAVIAWGVLFAMVVPRQRKMLATATAALEPREDASASTKEFESAKAQVTAAAGIFNLLVIIIFVLMFLPASIFS